MKHSIWSEARLKANSPSAPIMDTDMKTAYDDSSKAQRLLVLGYEPKFSVCEVVVFNPSLLIQNVFEAATRFHDFVPSPLRSE